jgi:D-serine deaminase-like pyridoxal phosphate-dependent protein
MKIPLDAYRVHDISGILTPALAFYPTHVDANIQATLALTGGPERWRPHIKTIKAEFLMQRLLMRGVTDWKCATPLELEAACEAGARDVLLAYPVVGASAARVLEIAGRYPEVRISVLVESVPAIARWRDAGVGIFIDLNPGMDRTGADPLDISRVIEMAREAGESFRGLHYYDGHIADSDLAERERKAHAAYDHLMDLIRGLEAVRIAPGEVITSGTPSFPYAMTYTPFAKAGFVHRISPGTVVLSDLSSLGQHPESYGYRPSALVLSSVVSHPTPDRATCDGGHKAVSADAGVPTCSVIGHPDLEPLKPSEEHLPLLARNGTRPEVGQVLYLLPRHICPTVNLFDRALIIENGRVTGVEPVTARGH